MRRSLLSRGFAMRQVDLLLASLWCVDAALLQRVGEYTGVAVGLLTASAIFGFLAVRARPEPTNRLVWAIAAGAIALTLQYYSTLYQDDGFNTLAFVASSAVFLALLVQRRSLTAVLLGVGGLAMGWAVVLRWRWGTNDIDVWTGVQVSASAVLHGHNPYGPTFPALYPHGLGFVTRQIHFDYGPIIPVLAAPARLLGDIRIASVVLFLALFAAVVAMARRRSDSDWATPRLLALCIASPLTVAMVDKAWVDIYSAAGFAGWVALRHRHRRLAVLCLAAGIASKPIFLPAMLPLLLWSRRARWESFWALVAAVVFILPFAIATGPSAFYHDVIGYLADFPFRPDSLSLNTSLFWSGRNSLPAWLGVSVVAVLGVWVASVRPRSYGDALAAGATLMTVSFLLARQAFFNYYFVSAAILLLAIAGRGVAIGEPEDVHLPFALDQRVVAWWRARGAPPAAQPAEAAVPALTGARD